MTQNKSQEKPIQQSTFVTKEEVDQFEKWFAKAKDKPMSKDVRHLGDEIPKSERLPNGIPGYIHNPITGICHWTIVQHLVEQNVIRKDGRYWLISNPSAYCRFEAIMNEIRRIRGRREFAQAKQLEDYSKLCDPSPVEMPHQIEDNQERLPYKED